MIMINQISTYANSETQIIPYIEIVFWVLGRVPMFTFDMNMKSCIFAHFGVIHDWKSYIRQQYPVEAVYIYK